MSFMQKIGQDSSKDQKLVLMRKKYFRNILDYNQVWRQERKDEENRAKQQSNRQFNKQIDKEQELLYKEKEQHFRDKLVSQFVLKEDYEKQMVEKNVKSKQQKQMDKEFLRMQQAETDRVGQRRLLDLMKIYDRKPVKQSLHRRIKTDTNQDHFLPLIPLNNHSISTSLNRTRQIKKNPEKVDDSTQFDQKMVKAYYPLATMKKTFDSLDQEVNRTQQQKSVLQKQVSRDQTMSLSVRRQRINPLIPSTLPVEKKTQRKHISQSYNVLPGVSFK